MLFSYTSVSKGPADLSLAGLPCFPGLCGPVHPLGLSSAPRPRGHLPEAGLGQVPVFPVLMGAQSFPLGHCLSRAPNTEGPSARRVPSVAFTTVAAALGCAWSAGELDLYSWNDDRFGSVKRNIPEKNVDIH